MKSREGATFELVVPKAKAYLAERSYVDKLKAALEQQLGSPVTLKVLAGEVTGGSGRLARGRRARGGAARRRRSQSTRTVSCRTS